MRGGYRFQMPIVRAEYSDESYEMLTVAIVTLSVVLFERVSRFAREDGSTKPRTMTTRRKPLQMQDLPG